MARRFAIGGLRPRLTTIQDGAVAAAHLIERLLYVSCWLGLALTL
jgi:hypothetical protein